MDYMTSIFFSLISTADPLLRAEMLLARVQADF